MGWSRSVSGFDLGGGSWSSRRSPAMSSTTTVIRFWVSVPVLSEQIVVTDPSVSTAYSRRMRALLASIRWAPRVRVMVTTAGRLSGIAATARLTAVSSSSSRSSPRSSPMPETTSTMTPATRASPLTSVSSRCCSGVLPASAPRNRSAIRPSSEPMPVDVTTSVPRPAVTLVPA